MSAFDAKPIREEIDLYRLCRTIIHRLIAQNQWHLFSDEESFVARVAARSQTLLAAGAKKPVHDVVVDATLYCYNHTWHVACLSTDQEQANQAYEQVRGYLRRLIQRLLLIRNREELARNRNFCEDAQQEILIRVVEGVATVVEPGYLLAWIKRISWRTLSELLERNPTERENEKFSQFDNGNEDDSNCLDEIEAPVSIDPLETDEFVNTLDTVLNQCLKPGDRRNVMKLVLLWEMRIFEIAKTLNLSPIQITQRKNRAIKILKECMALLIFLETFVFNLPQ